MVRQKSFKERAKKRKEDFTRNRNMTFNELIYVLLSMVKESSQNALERFFPQVGKEVSMSRQAFGAARQKIRWEAFQELFQAGVEGSYHEQWKRRRGYRLMAIDGSFIQPPSDPAPLKHFGGPGPAQTAVTALGSLLNDIIVDAKPAPLSANERSLAKEHLEVLTGLES